MFVTASKDHTAKVSVESILEPGGREGRGNILSEQGWHSGDSARLPPKLARVQNLDPASYVVKFIVGSHPGSIISHCWANEPSLLHLFLGRNKERT